MSFFLIFWNWFMAFCSSSHVYGIRFSLCTYSRMVLGQILHKKSLALMFQYLIENQIFFNLFDWENLPNMEILMSLIDTRIFQLALSLFASQKIEKITSLNFLHFKLIKWIKNQLKIQLINKNKKINQFRLDGSCIGFGQSFKKEFEAH